MSDVRTVYVTKEVAERLQISTGYTIKLAKTLNLSEAEMRDTGKRNYLFSEDAVKKIGALLTR